MQADIDAQGRLWMAGDSTGILSKSIAFTDAIKIASDVENLIKDALPSGIPSITQIGKHMGMSSRTLARRLSDSGITFRELVQQAQEKIAKGLLKDSSSTMGEIAFQTGFSEQSAFNRAFKRWTGQSATSFRKN